MGGLDFAINIVVSVLYAVMVLLALIYSLPILCIRRFQNRNNIFTVNVCLTTAFNSLLWLPTAISFLFGYSRETVPKMFPWLFVLQVVSDMTIPYSLVLVSFHRCCSIVYPHKRFFRTRTWIIVCLIGQWIVSGLLSMPEIVLPRRVRVSSR